MNLALVILLGGLITFGIRLLPILLLERMPIPGWLYRALRFVPVAVLSAIIVPELAYRDGALELSPLNPQLLAGLIAALVAWRTRNVLLTIAAGMAALVALRMLLPA